MRPTLSSAMDAAGGLEGSRVWPECPRGCARSWRCLIAPPQELEAHRRRAEGQPSRWREVEERPDGWDLSVSDLQRGKGGRVQREWAGLRAS